MRGDTTTVSRLLDTLAANQPTGNLSWPRSLSSWLGAFDVAERAARSQTDAGNQPEVRRLGLLNLARVLAGRGRWAEVEAALDRLRELDPIAARAERAVLTSLPWLEVPAGSLDGCRAELLEWRPAGPEPGTPLDGAYHAHRRAYYLALIASKTGDPETALAYADSLESLPDVSGIPTVVEGLTATVRADVAWRAGRRPADVLALLEPVRGEVPAYLWASDPMVGQEHARLLRALVLHDSGRHDEALRWLEHGFRNTPGWDYYMAPVHYLSAAAHEAAGRTDAAAISRGMFEELWGEADAPISLPPSTP